MFLESFRQRNFLHRVPCTHRKNAHSCFYTRDLVTHRKLLHRLLHTHRHIHTQTHAHFFRQRRRGLYPQKLCTQALYTQKTFTHRCLLKTNLLRAETFKHKCFVTQKTFMHRNSIHATAFDIRAFTLYTQKTLLHKQLLHIETLTQKVFHANACARTNSFTHRNLHTKLQLSPQVLTIRTRFVRDGCVSQALIRIALPPLNRKLRRLGLLGCFEENLHIHHHNIQF